MPGFPVSTELMFYFEIQFNHIDLHAHRSMLKIKSFMVSEFSHTELFWPLSSYIAVNYTNGVTNQRTAV